MLEIKEDQNEKESEESFGEYLKRERNMRGVTLEEISKSTNINKKFLAAIENDDYEDLPPDVFVRGFLHAYAKVIGLDNNEIILAYSEHARGDTENTTSDKKIKFVEKEKSRKTLLWVLGTIVLAAAAFFFFSNAKVPLQEVPKTPTDAITPEKETDLPDFKEKDPDKKISNEKKEEPLKPKKKVPTKENSLQKKQIKDKTKEKKIKKKSTSNKRVKSTSHILPKGPISLSIYASENLWLRIKIDEKKSKEALLNEGEQVVYKADTVLILTLGNIKGSILKLNGQDLILPEKKSNVLRDYKITIKDNSTDKEKTDTQNNQNTALGTVKKEEAR